MFSDSDSDKKRSETVRNGQKNLNLAKIVLRYDKTPLSELISEKKF